MKRILLTTVHRLAGAGSEICTEHVPGEAFYARGTRSQGVFAIRSHGAAWGLDLIAANLEAPATVLHSPTRRALTRELRSGYDVVGIDFSICTFPEAVELCALVRRVAPGSKIVLSGCGTALPECDAHADQVCRGEPVNFLRRLLGEPEVRRFQIPRITRRVRVLGLNGRKEAVLPAAFGCIGGCDFCRTSQSAARRSVPLLTTGRELHEAMLDVRLNGTARRDIGVVDEDFLADRGRIEPLIPLNQAQAEEPVLFSCMTSLQSLSQYRTEELLAMGLSGAWIGVESPRARHPKMSTPDVYREFGRLRGAGIVTLAYMSLGADGQDQRSLEEDFEHLLSLRPQFSRFMIGGPCVRTPSYAGLEREGRLGPVPDGLGGGVRAPFVHPAPAPERLEALAAEYARREYEELGPSLLRVVEVRLEGYLMLRYRVQPHLQARARAYRRQCVELFPLLGLAVRTAPSERVRRWAVELKEELEDTFEIPSSARLKAGIVPALAVWTWLKNRLRPDPRPRAEVHRYRS
jgi:hypothetical protein